MLNKCLLFFALALSGTMPMFATIITPGTSVVPSAFSMAGMTPASPIITGTINPGTFSADYQSQVAFDTNNIYCSGCLDFLYRIVNNGPDVIERTTMFDFDGFLTNVGFVVVPGSINPVEADRTATGGVVGFDFSTAGLAPGQSSSIIVIQTNATAYTTGLLSAQDGSAGTGSAYQPTLNSSPEPGSLILFGAGALGLAGLRFVKRRSSARC